MFLRLQYSVAHHYQPVLPVGVVSSDGILSSSDLIPSVTVQRMQIVGQNFARYMIVFWCSGTSCWSLNFSKDLFV
jgi:hypothetical protein